MSQQTQKEVVVKISARANPGTAFKELSDQAKGTAAALKGVMQQAGRDAARALGSGADGLKEIERQARASADAGARAVDEAAQRIRRSLGMASQPIILQARLGAVEGLDRPAGQIRARVAQARDAALRDMTGQLPLPTPRYQSPAPTDYAAARAARARHELQSLVGVPAERAPAPHLQGSFQPARPATGALAAAALPALPTIPPQADPWRQLPSQVAADVGAVRQILLGLPVPPPVPDPYRRLVGYARGAMDAVKQELAQAPRLPGQPDPFQQLRSGGRESLEVLQGIEQGMARVTREAEQMGAAFARLSGRHGGDLSQDRLTPFQSAMIPVPPVKDRLGQPRAAVQRLPVPPVASATEDRLAPQPAPAADEYLSPLRRSMQAEAAKRRVEQERLALLDDQAAEFLGVPAGGARRRGRSAASFLPPEAPVPLGVDASSVDKVPGRAKGAADSVRKSFGDAAKDADEALGKVGESMTPRLSKRGKENYDALMRTLGKAEGRMSEIGVGKLAKESTIDFFGISRVDREFGKKVEDIDRNLRSLKSSAAKVNLDGDTTKLDRKLKALTSQAAGLQKVVEQGLNAVSSSVSRAGGGFVDITRGLSILSVGNQGLEKMAMALLGVSAAADVARGSLNVLKGLIGTVANLAKLDTVMLSVGRAQQQVLSSTSTVRAALQAAAGVTDAGAAASGRKAAADTAAAATNTRLAITAAGASTAQGRMGAATNEAAAAMTNYTQRANEASLANQRFNATGHAAGLGLRSVLTRALIGGGIGAGVGGLLGSWSSESLLMGGGLGAALMPVIPGRYLPALGGAGVGGLAGHVFTGGSAWGTAVGAAAGTSTGLGLEFASRMLNPAEVAGNETQRMTVTRLWDRLFRARTPAPATTPSANMIAGMGAAGTVPGGGAMTMASPTAGRSVITGGWGAGFVPETVGTAGATGGVATTAGAAGGAGIVLVAGAAAAATAVAIGVVGSSSFVQNAIARLLPAVRESEERVQAQRAAARENRERARLGFQPVQQEERERAAIEARRPFEDRARELRERELQAREEADAARTRARREIGDRQIARQEEAFRDALAETARPHVNHRAAFEDLARQQARLDELTGARRRDQAANPSPELQGATRQVERFSAELEGLDEQVRRERGGRETMNRLAARQAALDRQVRGNSRDMGNPQERVRPISGDTVDPEGRFLRGPARAVQMNRGLTDFADPTNYDRFVRTLGREFRPAAQAAATGIAVPGREGVFFRDARQVAEYVTDARRRGQQVPPELARVAHQQTQIDRERGAVGNAGTMTDAAAEEIARRRTQLAEQLAAAQANVNRLSEQERQRNIQSLEIDRQRYAEISRFHAERARQIRDEQTSDRATLGLMEEEEQRHALDIGRRLAQGGHVDREEIQFARGIPQLREMLEDYGRDEADRVGVAAQLERLSRRGRMSRDDRAAAHERLADAAGNARDRTAGDAEAAARPGAAAAAVNLNVQARLENQIRVEIVNNADAIARQLNERLVPELLAQQRRVAEDVAREVVRGVVAQQAAARDAMRPRP